MAQPNVAREPSMEEILASIRRIIESNEPTAEGPSQQAVAPLQFEEEPIELDDEDFHSEPANDPGLPPLRPVAVEEVERPRLQPVETAPADRSLSLADVAARVRAASARQMEHAAARPVAIPPSFASVPLRETIAPVVEPVAATAAERLVEPERVADVAQVEPQPRHEPVAAQPVESVAPPKLAAFAERPVEQISHVENVAPTFEPVSAVHPVRAAEPAAAPVDSLPSKIEIAAANLISEQAGAQVARSFNELAAVFDGLERRSVEDMAQEMLRPMLQEWLDDNLPTLVERLVREEIERVARGNRR